MAQLAPPAPAALHGKGWALRASAARWREYLLAPVDGASIALFRISFGLLLLWEVWRYLDYNWIEQFYIAPHYHFSYLPFVQPWAGDGMYWHFFALGVAALMVALGLYYRLAAGVLCLAFTYVFLLDKTRYLNHFYLICLISFLMLLIPAHRALSLDRRLSARPAPPMVPRWALLVLRFQIVLIYVYGGVAKLNPDWLAGVPIGAWLAARSDVPLIGPWLAHPWAGVTVAWSGLAIDLAVGFLLLSRRTFWLGLAAAAMFHALNAQLFEIGIFPFMMLATLVLFPRPDWPRRLLPAAPPADEAPPDRQREPPRVRRAATTALLVLLHIYVLAQVAVPLRHWLYPGDVAWTEEGHRYSWRMKLRDKAGSVAFFLTDPLSKERQEIDLAAWLTGEQRRTMAGRPDMIQQFAHYLAKQYEAANGRRPIVTVESLVELNYRPPAPLIDPTVDLAAQPFSLAPAPWILPPP